MAGQAELTSQQRRSLAGDGYLLLPSVLAADATGALALRLDGIARAAAQEWDATPGTQWEEAGVVRIRLDAAEASYAPCVHHPLLFSAAHAVIGPGCEVNGLSLRAPLPGCGHQGLHPDFFPGHRTSGPWQVLAGLWCITAFTLCVPIISSTSCDQAIFVDQASDASLSLKAVLLEIDGFG